jgi:hypothetical protein
MVVESAFELEFTCIAAVKVHSYYYNTISTSKKTWCYFAVVFVCTVQCFTKKNFRSFCGCHFSSNLRPKIREQRLNLKI